MDFVINRWKKRNVTNFLDTHEFRRLSSLLVDHSMTDYHRTVVGRRCKQWIVRMKRNRSNGAFMMSKNYL